MGYLLRSFGLMKKKGIGQERIVIMSREFGVFVVSSLHVESRSYR